MGDANGNGSRAAQGWLALVLQVIVMIAGFVIAYGRLGADQRVLETKMDALTTVVVDHASSSEKHESDKRKRERIHEELRTIELRLLSLEKK